MTGRTSKAEARRDEILKAASACFAEKGLRGASINDICTRLKISPGHLYYYFKSKDSIIEALLDQMRDAQVRDLEQEVTTRGGVMNLFLTGDYILRTDMGDDAYIDEVTVWEVYAEAARNPHGRTAEQVHAHWKAADDILRARIQASQAAGEIRADADLEIVLTVMCMAVITGQMARFADPAFDAERYKAAARHVLAPFATEAAISRPAKRRA